MYQIGQFIGSFILVALLTRIASFHSKRHGSANTETILIIDYFVLSLFMIILSFFGSNDITNFFYFYLPSIVLCFIFDSLVKPKIISTSTSKTKLEKKNMIEENEKQNPTGIGVENQTSIPLQDRTTQSGLEQKMNLDMNFIKKIIAKQIRVITFIVLLPLTIALLLTFITEYKICKHGSIAKDERYCFEDEQSKIKWDKYNEGTSKFDFDSAPYIKESLVEIPQNVINAFVGFGFLSYPAYLFFLLLRWAFKNN